jgi:DNA-binding MarR family transcriptional regulator
MVERSLYFNSNYLARFIGDIWKEGYEELEISPSHANLILLCLQSPGIVQRDVAKKLHLEKSTITRAIDKLIERDFLLRKESLTGNKKEKCIFPTEKSKNIENRILEINIEMEMKISNMLEQDKFLKLHDLIDNIIDNIK